MFRTAILSAIIRISTTSAVETFPIQNGATDPRNFIIRVSFAVSFAAAVYSAG